MSTPFICRQCVARLAKFSTRRLIPKRSQPHPRGMHTSGPPPAWLLKDQDQNIRVEQADATDDVEADVSASRPLSNLEQGQKEIPEKLQEPKPPWDEKIIKFYLRRRPEVQQLAEGPRAATAYELKAKILWAFEDYSIVHEDLMYIYGLSFPEARHAAGQLGRLLGGRPSKDAGRLLDHFLDWKKNLNSLTQTTGRSPLDAENQTNLAEKGAWAFLQEQDIATMKSAWHRLRQDKRESLWPQMALSAFGSRSSIMPSFIRATFHPSWCPSYVIEDIVYSLFRASETAQGNEQMREDITELITFLLKECPPRYLNIQQTVIWKVMSSMPTPRLVEFYQNLKRAEHPLHRNTLLHFASRFAKSSQYKMKGAEIIYSLINTPNFDINSPASSSVCTSLLTLGEDDVFPDGDAAPDQLFKLLLDGGFRPNLLGLSALMRNFCVRGHPDTAWTIFDLLLEHGIEPDAHVYSILLNGSKYSSDTASIRRVTDMISSRESWSVVLANDLLNLIFRENEAQNERRRRQRKKANNAWRPMLQIYAKLFQLSPLQRITRFPLENLLVARSTWPKYSTYVTTATASLRALPEYSRLQPDGTTLLIMLGAHIRSIYGPRNIIRYYRHIMPLLRERDPVALKLVEMQGTRLYDIFVRALMQFKGTTQYALKIVTRMVMRNRREKRLLGKNIRFPMPSVYTWTVVLNGLKNHRQPRAAVSVLNTMVHEGRITPNLVTWNALIGAFTRTGNVRGAVRAMRYLERAGFQSNERTVAAFSLMPKAKREWAIELLEQTRQRPVDLRNTGAFLSDVKPPPATSSIEVRRRRNVLRRADTRDIVGCGPAGAVELEHDNEVGLSR
ncbi:hypothetical protein F4779DRAFT_568942 [Xylariaceae sp. FL0662B]|nr:hypothetical protein F4779DRAFT_568942 [Xylariaceae sp. FL0662B]